MFTNISILELETLKENKSVTPISRWETFEKAATYYSKIEGNYTAQVEDLKNMKSAYSTPVRVYLIRN